MGGGGGARRPSKGGPWSREEEGQTGVVFEKSLWQAALAVLETGTSLAVLKTGTSLAVLETGTSLAVLKTGTSLAVLETGTSLAARGLSPGGFSEQWGEEGAAFGSRP